MNNQEMQERRVYVVTAKNKLLSRVKDIGLEYIVDDFARPQVVMTAEVPFEEYLEGWRAKILELCKIRFLKENLIDCPIVSEEIRIKIFGEEKLSAKLFDRWWLAEESALIEIPTTWKK